MYNLDKEKKIILFLSLPLFAMSFLILFFGSGSWAIGAKQEGDWYGDYSSETIYENCECADCNCRNTGKKLIEFKGPDAECENYMDEDARMKCYHNNSQASYACPDLEDKGEVEDCYEKYRGSAFEYNQGGAGTMVTTNSYGTNGSRMYMLGSDCNGEHILKTGTNEPNSSAITLRDSSRDVHYGGDINVAAGITMNSSQGGAYFGSDVEYSYADLGNGADGQKIVSYDNFNGLNLNGCLDMKVLSNHNNLVTLPGEDRERFAHVEIEKGIEINGDLKMDNLFFQGRPLKWSEPIRGHFVLYYEEAGTPPTEGCTAPDLPRDTPPKPYSALTNIPATGYGTGGGTGGGSGGGGGITNGSCSGTNPYHHYNSSSWHGKGSSIVFCPGQSYSSCSIGGQALTKHGNKDKGRDVWTDYNTAGLSGTVTCTGSSGSFTAEVQ